MACKICKKRYVPSSKDNSFDFDGKPHVCTTCGNSFSLKIQLKRHMVTHEGGVPYICNACEKQDNQAHNLRLSKNGNKHVCETCNKTFTTKRMLLKHTSEHTSIDSSTNLTGVKYEAAQKPRNVLTKSKTHKDVTPKPYQCWDCNKSFAHLLTFQKHSVTHKKHKCGTCGESFTSKEGLDNHRSIRCDKNKNVLNDSGEKKHVCSICNKNFARKSALEGHIISHLTDKTESGYEDDSDKDADFLCDLKGEKPLKQSLEMCLPKLKIRRSYPCEICEKVCASKKVLEKHLQSHQTLVQKPMIEKKDLVAEEKKTYVCRICNETFLSKVDYKKHKLCHTQKPSGESNSTMKEIKTYVCKVCTKVFNKKKHLKKHYFKSHSNPTDIHKSSSPSPNKHQRKKQKRTKNLSCKTCGKLFAGETCLKKHEAKHLGDGTECLVIKEKKVKSVQPLICPVCNEDFTGRRFAFVRHKLSHTPEVCGICDARFADRQCLREHLKTHIGTEEAKKFLECSQRSLSDKNKNVQQHPEAKVEYIYLVLR